MKIKNLFLTLVAFSALAIGGCSQPEGSSSSSTSDPTSEPGHVHSFESAWTADEDQHWHKCTGCDAVSEQGPHTFVEKELVEATCEVAEHKVYECSVCGYSKIEYTGHSLKEHNYKVTITKVATCSEEGEITFECEDCHQKAVEKYSDPKAHVFAEPTVNEGITSYRCTKCDFVRTTIDHSEDVEATVNTDALKSAGEVELQHAAISFPESALEEFGEEVTISANEVQAADIETVTDAEVKRQIADAKIVDFAMKNGEEDVTQFNGKLTVSIPYDLKEGEDPSGIVVWYLDEDGRPNPIEAEYRNGFATFETNHFSFYAVLHMSAEELCAQFGHVEMTALTVPSTCAAHGYKDIVCRRCGHTSRTELPLANHTYKFVEKKDSTTTEEGYIKYRCETCGDEQITPIAKKPEEEKGFYTSLLLSLATSEFHVTGVANVGGQENVVDMYYGYDENHVPFAYGDAMGSEIGLYKGYTYNSAYRKGEAPDQVLAVVAQFEELFDMLPGFVPTYIEKAGEFAVSKFFNKVEIPEGFEISINKEAVVEIVTDFCTKPLNEALTSFFGPEFLVKLSSFITKAYGATVADVIADLEAQGIVLSEILESAKNICGVVAPEYVEMIEAIDLDTILTEEVKAMNFLDFVKMLVPAKYSSMIPVSAEAVLTLLNGFLQMNLLDIIKMLQPVSQADPAAPVYKRADAEPAEEEPSMADEVIEMVEAVLEKLEFSLKTQATGEIISMSLSLSDYGKIFNIGAQVGDVSFLVVKGFDKQEVIAKLEKMVGYTEKAENVFKLSQDNVAFLEEFYGQQFKGVKFNYFEEYTDPAYASHYIDKDGQPVVEYPSALVSKENVKYKVFDETQGKLVQYEGQLVLLSHSNSDYWHNVVINRKGLGTKLGLGEKGLIANSYEFAYQGIFRYTIESEGGETAISHRIGEYSWRGEESLISGQFLYAFDQDKVYSTTGSFSYLNRSMETFKLISAEEYKALRPGSNPSVEEGYKIIYYSYTDESGYTGVSWREVQDTNYLSERNYSLDSTCFIDPDMDDEALEHCDLFTLGVYYENDSLVYKPQALVYPDSYSRYLSGEGSSFVSGNSMIMFDIVDSSKECTKIVNWSYRVGNKVAKTGSYTQHVLDHDYENRIEKRTQLSPCVERVDVYYKCEHCGKIYFTDWYYSEHHNFEETLRVEGSLAQPGYIVETCSNCGEQHGRLIPPCTHQNHDIVMNEETGVEYFVCNDCGYEVESSDVPLMAIECVNTTEDAYVYAYLFYNSYYYNTDETSRNYQFFLTVQQYDEETEEWVFVEGSNIALYPYTEYEEFEVPDYDIWTNYPHFYFNIGVEDLNNLKEQYSEEGYRVVFACIAYDMGTSFIMSL